LHRANIFQRCNLNHCTTQLWVVHCYQLMAYQSIHSFLYQSYTAATVVFFHFHRRRRSIESRILPATREKKTKNKTSKSIQVRIHGINLGIPIQNFFFFLFSPPATATHWIIYFERQSEVKIAAHIVLTRGESTTRMNVPLTFA
jgi:hypothetical protein